MRLYRAIRTSCYLMIAIGVFSLSLAERSLAYLVFIGIGCGLHWVADGVFALPKRVASIVGLCIMAAGIGDYLFVSGDFVISIARFLIMIQMVLIFQRPEERQYGLIYIISFILLTVSAIITIDITFFISFILFAVTATWAMILLYLKEESEIAASPREVDEAALRTRTDDSSETVAPYTFKLLFGRACFVTVLTLAMTFFIFYAIPRFRVGLLARGAFGPTQPITGFSESVELGEIGGIKKNPQRVMNIQLFKGEDNEPYNGWDLKLLWRGIALDKYDGRRWMATNEIEDVSEADGKRNRKRVTDLTWHLQYDTKRKNWVAMELSKEGDDQYVRPFPMPASPDGSVDITSGYAGVQRSIRSTPATIIRQRFSLAPINTKLLFSLYPPVRIILLDEPTPLTFNVANQALGVEFPRVGQLSYGAVCVYPRLAPQMLREASDDHTSRYAELVRSTCTQLPQPMERVKRLAQELAPNDQYPTVYDKAKRVEQYLSDPKNFSYTLNLELTPGVDPIEDFLFNRKSGHCEYFASAMVIVLRTFDIPARLVNGFSGGEWNNWTKSYVVRQSDAHSWVEVYFPNVGWVSFDPTPAAGRAQRRTGLVAEASRFMDFLRAKWMTGVIGYDLSEQSRFLRGVGSVLSALGEKLSLVRRRNGEGASPEKDDDSSLRQWRIPNIFEKVSFHWKVPAALKGVAGQVVSILIIACTVVVVFWAARKIVSHIVSLMPARQRTRASIRFYEDFLKIMLKKGFQREAHHTPLEFAQIVLAESKGGNEEGMGGALEAAAWVTETFCAARYGGKNLSDAEKKELNKALQKVSALRHRQQEEPSHDRVKPKRWRNDPARVNM